MKFPPPQSWLKPDSELKLKFFWCYLQESFLMAVDHLHFIVMELLSLWQNIIHSSTISTVSTLLNTHLYPPPNWFGSIDCFYSSLSLRAIFSNKNVFCIDVSKWELNHQFSQRNRNLKTLHHKEIGENREIGKVVLKTPSSNFFDFNSLFQYVQDIFF